MCYNDIRDKGPREKTVESRITETLRYLEKRNILKKSRSCGAPQKKKNANYKRDRKCYYQLRQTQTVFSRIFDIYLNNRPEKLLKSKYCNSAITEIGFDKIYKIMEERLTSPDFKRIASNSLLKLPAVKGYYIRIAQELQQKMFDSYAQTSDKWGEEHNNADISRLIGNLSQEIAQEPVEAIEMLSNFEPIQAVHFYRDTLNIPFTNTYDELSKASVITKGLCDFLAFDNYLSPLTADPANNIVRILFSRPFDRIFEDAYLLKADTYSPERDAFWVLSGRAAAIYNSFSDFLLEYFRVNSFGPGDIEIITREMIYSWNVASTRFDIVCYYLAGLLEQNEGSGNYHLKSDGLSYNIIDLESGRSLLPPDISSSLLEFGSIPQIIEPDEHNENQLRGEVMREPFAYLRPCNTFKEMGWRSELISSKDILEDLGKKSENLEYNSDT